LLLGLMGETATENVEIDRNVQQAAPPAARAPFLKLVIEVLAHPLARSGAAYSFLLAHTGRL